MVLLEKVGEDEERREQVRDLITLLNYKWELADGYVKGSGEIMRAYYSGKRDAFSEARDDATKLLRNQDG